MKRELSPREKEVLDLIVQGYRTKQVARELEISPRTVEHHIQNSCDAFGIPREGRVLLAVMYFALKHGIPFQVKDDLGGLVAEPVGEGS